MISKKLWLTKGSMRNDWWTIGETYIQKWSENRWKWLNFWLPFPWPLLCERSVLSFHYWKKQIKTELRNQHRKTSRKQSIFYYVIYFNNWNSLKTYWNRYMMKKKKQILNMYIIIVLKGINRLTYLCSNITKRTNNP